MTAHDHPTYDPMCWRCDLARDELDQGMAPEPYTEAEGLHLDPNLDMQ